MKEKKTEHLTITLAPSEKAEIIKRAEQERRKPSEFIYLLVIDNLKKSKEIYSKKDLLNSLNDYIQVLKQDEKANKYLHDQKALTIISNVIFSLSEIVEGLNQ